MKTLLILVLFLGVAAAHGATYEELQDAAVARAVALYPGSGEEGSPLFKAVEAQIEVLKAQSPVFFDNPEWPVILVTMEAAKLGIAPTTQTVAPTAEETYQPAAIVEEPELYAYVSNNPRGRIFKTDGGYKDVTVPPGIYSIAEDNGSRFAISFRGETVYLFRAQAVVGSMQELKQQEEADEAAYALAQQQQSIQQMQASTQSSINAARAAQAAAEARRKEEQWRLEQRVKKLEWEQQQAATQRFFDR